MEILTRCASIRDRVKIWKQSGLRVALVPTAGALHKGHLRLIAEAQERADRTVVSVFAGVESQPQLVAADRELLHNIAPDVLFVPPPQELFPFGRDGSVRLGFPCFESALAGIAPLQALGEAITVIAKLLHAILPDCVVFGEQDFFELVLTRRLVDDLFLGIDVIECATFRDSDGLALATADKTLEPEDRPAAAALYATLLRMAERLKGGERDFTALIEQASSVLRAEGLSVEYLHIRDANDLGAVRPASRDLVILAATQLKQVALSDALRVHLVEHY